MGQSLLKQIQATTIKYANIVANVLSVEVEIVDNNLFRIAGTGIFKDRIDEDISQEGYIYKNALDTGNNNVVYDPGQNSLCENCHRKFNCIEKMQICTPIKYKNDIIGVIGLICTEEEQKQRILKNIDSHMEFVNQIADFISSKVYEHLEIQRNSEVIRFLKQIIDSIDKGVIVIDEDGKIADMNNSAMRQLKLSPSNIKSSISLSSNNEYIMGGEEFSVRIEEKNYTLVGQLIYASNGIENYDRIFMFNRMKKLKNDVYNLTTTNEIINSSAIVGKSRAIKNIKEKIQKVASSKSTVLITGESGTGKELIARAIHSEGDRADKPFIAINCGAIPDTLLESELFGYVRGAFSGASPSGRIGKFELANRGVIFLDEIGDMPLYLQVKLLRVLQERKLVRIGSNQVIDLDIRVIAATNKDLKQLIRENKFREDLYYRLNVIPIDIPPLREKKEDIELLINKFMDKYTMLLDKYVHTIEEKTKKELLNYPWPGNIRELENTIEFMINLADDRGILTVDMLPRDILNSKKKLYVDVLKDDLEIRSLNSIEMDYINYVLDFCGRDTKGKQLAAKKLGIGTATLYRKLGEEKQ